MLNDETGRKDYYHEYVYRMSGKYPHIKIEVIVPRKGVFSHPFTDKIPSPEELARDTFLVEATLEAAGILNVAMKPYKSRQSSDPRQSEQPGLPSSATQPPNHALAEPDLEDMISVAERAVNATKRPRQFKWDDIVPRRPLPANTASSVVSTMHSRSSVTLRESEPVSDEEPIPKRRRSKKTLQCSTCYYGTYVVGRGQTRSQCYSCCNDPAKGIRWLDTPMRT